MPFNLTSIRLGQFSSIPLQQFPARLPQIVLWQFHLNIISVCIRSHI
ncbi:hypothetical protein MtrunA17_Chr7g0240011 [Medicago truncatula]|uniref:Uncharacterized protein n=1 Tax=Medicago truncatula TaxID=3880 RepID=A0A396H5L5_MEDTR|nr:hypothetical protein MtrunA17_Chr7g0240011 [Medicago truncatula]